MTKKEKDALILYEAKLDFNDIVCRELGLSTDENDHIIDLDIESILMIKDKYIKYTDDQYPKLMHNEIDLNLIENPRLTEILFGRWVERRAQSKGIEITSMYQSAIRGSNKGFFVVTYDVLGEPREKKSDIFVNESVRIFNLICKLNHTEHLYKTRLEKLDIEIIRKNDV